MSRFSVMQVIDTLDLGGAERVAVNVANELARGGHRSFLCTTRRDGPLASELDPEVGRLSLQRRSRLELGAVQRLARFVDEHEIDLLHAHGSALFVSVLASLVVGRRPRRPKIVWHDHFGLGIDRHTRSPLAYRVLTTRVAAVIAVSDALAGWSRHQLKVPAARVHFVPNFVPQVVARAPGPPVTLPGVAGKRIVCVANLHAPKDHPTLLAALRLVVEREPAAHLILVGAESDPAYVAKVREDIDRGLAGHVTLLGQRFDVPAIDAGCDIGVSSSRSEGMPLAVLEYGANGLAVVASDVGQCAEVLDRGRAGIIVPPANVAAMASALGELLASPDRRRALGATLRARVQKHYDLRTAMDHILAIYRAVA